MTLPASHAHGPGGPRPVEHFHPLSPSEILHRLGDVIRKLRPEGDGPSTSGGPGIELPPPPPLPGLPSLPGSSTADDTETDPSQTDTSQTDTADSSEIGANLGPGWVQFASWTCDEEDQITHCSGTWTVPPAPEDVGNQVVFLFLGLQTGATDGTELYQPVLQWGPSAAGGGKYWSVSCWYVHKGRMIYSPLVRVSPGEILDTRVERTVQNEMGSQWECVATARNSGAETKLPVVGDVRLGWVNTTLEAYSADISCTQFPRTPATTFRQITLRCGDRTLTPQWKPTVNYHGCQNQVLIDSPEETRLIYQ